jgi:hypothetical protein
VPSPEDPRGHYSLRGDNVLQRISARPEVWDDWLALADQLTGSPRTAGDSIRDFDALPSTYTAEFDAAVLMYQVMADYPIVELLQVTWLRDFLNPGVN